jgi:transposase
VELLHERCAALDIGKKDLKACVRTPSPSGKRSRRQEIRTFATTTNALLELRDWLVAEKVTLVVMEATGDYWRGAFYLLEDCLTSTSSAGMSDHTSIYECFFMLN